MSGLSRERFEALWERLDAKALEFKQSNEATVRLERFYSVLDEEDRHTVNEILSDWVSHGDSRRRFDALALVQEFNIHSCLTAVRDRLARLEHAIGPSVPYDKAKLKRIISRLEVP